MPNNNDLSRFEEIQKDVYGTALNEIRAGKKMGHWMWFIFPQIQGLGSSDLARYYAIKDKVEATQYLKHELLGKRLIEISRELLMLDTNDAVNILGQIDSLKLRSSMTLFSLLENTDPVFQRVINKFFGGNVDERTVALLNG